MVLITHSEVHWMMRSGSCQSFVYIQDLTLGFKLEHIWWVIGKLFSRQIQHQRDCKDQSSGYWECWETLYSPVWRGCTLFLSLKHCYLIKVGHVCIYRKPLSKRIHLYWYCMTGIIIDGEMFGIHDSGGSTSMSKWVPLNVAPFVFCSSPVMV